MYLKHITMAHNYFIANKALIDLDEYCDFNVINP